MKDGLIIIVKETFSSCPAIFVHGRSDENFGIKIYYDFWLRKKNLVWTNKKFVYLTFIGQKISYFRHYVHVRKSPDKMKWFLIALIFTVT